MVNLYTKFEVSRCTRFEGMNGGAKCRKWGDLGWLGGTQGHRQCHHLALPQGVSPVEFPQIFGVRKQESLGYRVVLFV